MYDVHGSADFCILCVVGRADLSGTGGQAVIDFARLHPTLSSPSWFRQNAFAQRFQTWTLTADVYLNKGGNTACDIHISGGSHMFWQTLNAATSQHWSVNTQGTITRDVPTFFLWASCSGNTRSVVAFDNVYFTLNT